ncbi:MAG: UbiX family flavin prenyltransferase, partial [Alphaproteobacteria bacterium]|nr:UbiX family flavin prenyltransferase [Alphaproteobacteria bacterium]
MSGAQEPALKTLIVAITGASGAIIGVRLIEVLHDLGSVETHLLVSKWGRQTLEHETDWTLARVRALATHYHPPGEMSAEIASGSYRTDGMVIAPCSMRTAAAVAAGYGDTMIHRAADVVLKERRPLVLVPREAPLSAIHLENLLKLARLGVAIVPPVPAFYNHPRTLADVVDHIVARVLDQLGISAELA